MGIKKIPVLKRNDYIKEFETVVKQEIALHNKKIQETDNHLNDFRKAISEHKNLIRSRIDELEKHIVSLHKYFDVVYKKDHIFHDLETRFGDFELYKTNIADLIDDIWKEFESMATMEDLETNFLYLEAKIDDVVMKVSEYEKDFHHKIQLLKKEFERQLQQQQIKQDFLEQKIESQNIEIEQIKECLKKCTYDSDWIKDDSKRRNKVIMILEKKFEYLDERIKRIRESQK